MSKYLSVLIGGGIGAVLRFAIGTFVLRVYTGLFPLGTFLINVSGSFLVGVLMTLFFSRPAIHPNWRLFAVTGILGGYTTFSSFEWETLTALESGAPMGALLNVVMSVSIGFAGVWLGAVLARYVWR